MAHTRHTVKIYNRSRLPDDQFREAFATFMLAGEMKSRILNLWPVENGYKPSIELKGRGRPYFFGMCDGGPDEDYELPLDIPGYHTEP
jgi:hypothetical protein